MKSFWRRRPVLAWAFYDWANSAFALSVLAVLFPIFFGNYWSAGDDGATVTARLGLINGSASLIVALLAPMLGAIADRGGTRKRFLFLFATLGIVMTGGLFFVARGAWPIALGMYMFAAVGFYSANSFYDSLIVNVAEKNEYEQVSAFGFATGYFGSAILLTVNVFMINSPASFGLESVEQAVKVAFVLVALWWAVFSIPIMLIVREPAPEHGVTGHSIAEGYRQLIGTFREIRRYRHVFIFLIAYWLYIDGVHTVILMAVDFGRRLQFTNADLTQALLITNFVGFPATLFFGWLGTRIGPKRAIYIGLFVYASVSVYAVFLENVRQFYMMAITIGLVQGGVQSMSRSLFASLTPKDKAAEFFGFYNMLGKFAAVLGPFLVSMAAIFSDDPKLTIAVLLPLFVAGALLLTRVPSPNEQASA